MSAKILIVEDELIIAEDIREKITSFGYTTVDVVDNFDDALSIIKEEKMDLVLLDIALKGNKTGIDVAKELDALTTIPYIFLTSNHDQATLQAVKQVHPSSYLMKPFKQDDLYMAIELAFQNKTTRPAAKDQDHIFIKEGHSFQKIKTSDIRYLQSEGVYIELHTQEKRYITRDSFKNILLKLPADKFVQTHKSYYINTDHIASVSAISVYVGEVEIPLGRTYKDEFLKNLGISE